MSDQAKLVNDMELQEYLRACADIRAQETNNDRIYGLSITVTFSAAVLGTRADGHYWEIFAGIPFVIFGAVVYMIMTYECIASLAGYKEAFAQRLNAKAGANLLCWEEVVKDREKTTLARIFLTLIYALYNVLVTVFCVCQVKQMERFAPTYIVYGHDVPMWQLIADAAAVMVVIICVSGFSFSRRFRHTLTTTQKMQAVKYPAPTA